MQFFLPENLQVQLIPYDPTLKKLARNTQSKTKSTKSKFPLGQPYNIIPESVIKTSLVQDAIDNINANPARDRFHEFRKMTGTLEDRQFITAAVLYHYESCWYAAWLPPEGQEGQYVYGYAYSYKNLPTARKMVPYTVSNNLDNCTLVTYGKSEFITYQKLVTKQDIIDNKDTDHWLIPSLTYDKGHRIREICTSFKKALSNTIPTWSDNGSMFERLKANKVAKILDLSNILEKEELETWKPSVDNILKLIDRSILDTSNYHKGQYRDFIRIRHIIDTPFFRKWIGARCAEVITRFSDPDNTSYYAVLQPWKKIFVLLKAIDYVHKIWPVSLCPIDYYQNHVDVLLSIQSYYQRPSVETITWLTENMPAASYFHIAKKFTADTSEQCSRTRSVDKVLGHNLYHFSEWEDTISMLNTVLDTGKTLDPPKRWRIMEFHDYVQAEAWKIKHPNESLPQDLFPNPIKVQTNEQTWTFFQPVDLHQLSSWGQAVRNCVGNAKHYADDIKKKKHFIVLAMVEKKPLFTIQLEVNNGMMSVKQIKGVSNQPLTEKERDDYTKAFGDALRQRNEELV